MKAFQFTLEAVRTVRQRQEQVAMEQYAQALLGRSQALSKLEGVQQELQTCWHELRTQLTAGCTAIAAAQAHDYHRVLVRRHDECTQALGLAERRVNTALRAMLGARQQRETVDQYFDKQKAAHQREVNRNEQKFTDEIAGRRNNSVFALNPTRIPT